MPRASPQFANGGKEAYVTLDYVKLLAPAVMLDVFCNSP